MTGSFIPLLILITFAVSMTLCACLPGLALSLGLSSKLSFRRHEENPVPLVGGICIFLAALLTLVFSLNANLAILLCAAVPLIGLAILDDLLEVKARWKILAQIISAVIFLAVVGPHNLLFTKMGLPPFAASALGIFLIVSMCNAYNFLDGIDGQVALVSVVNFAIVASFSPSAAFSAAVMISAVLGFFVFNKPPASIYLGEAGSSFLGFAAAALALTMDVPAGPLGSTFGLCLLFSVPFCDIALAIVRRKFRKQSVTAPDREHFHHRLLRIGLSKWQCLAVTSVLVLGSNLAGQFCFSTTDANAALMVGILASLLLSAMYILVIALENLIQSRVGKIQSFLSKRIGTSLQPMNFTKISGPPLFRFDLSSYFFELAGRETGAIEQFIEEVNYVLNHLVHDATIYLVDQSAIVLTANSIENLTDFERDWIATNIKKVLSDFQILKNALRLPEGLHFIDSLEQFPKPATVTLLSRVESADPMLIKRVS